LPAPCCANLDSRRQGGGKPPHSKVVQSLENIPVKIPMVGMFLLALALLITPARAADNALVLPANERHHIEAALAAINMTKADLGFAKDHGEPLQVLQWIRDELADPLGMPVTADRILRGVTSEKSDTIWSTAASLLEIASAPATDAAPDASNADMWEGLDPALAQSLAQFMDAAHRANDALDRAFGKLTHDEQSYLAASWLAGLFNAEDRADVRAALVDTGISKEDVDRAIRESLDIDPNPAATNHLAIASKIDMAALLEAGRIFQQGVRKMYNDAQRISTWPSGSLMVVTELGKVRIATKNNEKYVDRSLLIIERGGDNVYGGQAGIANGLQQQRLSAIIDLSGRDEYRGTGMPGAGSALFGVSIVIDSEGDDLYEAAFTGQAAGMYGVGWVDDRSGDDTYRAYAMAQGAAVYGLGYLRDRKGSDHYVVGYEGQAFSGTLGVGLLVDDEGDDVYFAGGREPDHERNQDRFVSLAQGFSIGLRPYAGGGAAALIDIRGNDTYIADIFGQGASYWYSAGFLLDVAGHDTYRVYQYGQGTGIHLSLGLLADGSGNDTYTGGILTQGSAHDFAVGMLVDREGNDFYTALRDSQGHAMNNALAILVDSAGDDGYFALEPDRCQGAGNDGGYRDYGSLALLVDLAGTDRYASGAADGARLRRPLYGIIYDLKE
ncbi:MAG: hypothetical protein V1929_01185, partial [bacterium]